jgi:hypothetical protein
MRRDDTPARSISTAALDIGALAAEDVVEHLRRLGHMPDVRTMPAGLVERIASWIARGASAVVAPERAEIETLRAELERVNAQLRAVLKQRSDERNE